MRIMRFITTVVQNTENAPSFCNTFSSSEFISAVDDGSASNVAEPLKGEALFSILLQCRNVEKNESMSTDSPPLLSLQSGPGS